MKEIILVLLNEFADWEGAFFVSCLDQGVIPGNSVGHAVKILSQAKDTVISIGGLRVLPDYDLNELPEDLRVWY